MEGSECSACLSADTLPGNLGPFAQWGVKNTLEDTQIFLIAMLCAAIEGLGLAPALQMRDLSWLSYHYKTLISSLLYALTPVVSVTQTNCASLAVSVQQGW